MLDATVDNNVDLLEIYWAVTLCRMMYVAPDNQGPIGVYMFKFDKFFFFL